MQRPWWNRAVAVLLAAWFAIAVIEPAMLHVCPMHDGAARAHAGHAAGHADHAGDDGSEESRSHCTCLGECIGAASAALPPSLPRVPVPAAVATVRQLRSTEAQLRPSSIPGLFLPFANGPPSAA